MKKRSIVKPIEKAKKVEDSGQSRPLRRQKIINSDTQLINCHCCKTVDSAVNMMTCGRLDCRESFCINCIKKTYLKFNSNFFLILKEKENNNCWKCYKCVRKCPCKDCKDEKDKQPQRTMLRRKRKFSEKKPAYKSERKIEKVVKIERKNEKNDIDEKEKEIIKNEVIKKKIMLKKPNNKINNTIKTKNNRLTLNSLKIDESKLRDTIVFDDFFIMEFESSDIEEIPNTISENKQIEVVNDNIQTIKINDFNDTCKKNDENYLLSLLNDKNGSHDIPSKNHKSYYKRINPRMIESNLEKSKDNTLNFLNSINSLKTFEGLHPVNNNKSNQFKSLIKKESASSNFKEDLLIITNQTKKEHTKLNLNVNQPQGNQSKIQLFAPFTVSKDVKNLSNGANVVNNINNNLNIYITNNAVNHLNTSDKKLTTSNDLINKNCTSFSRKPLNKPCNVCCNSHYNKSEILKFNNLNLICTTLREYIEKREKMLEEDFEKLKQIFYMDNYVKNDYNFEKNKNILKDMVIEEDEENFKRSKRICKKCIYAKLEEQEGVNLILDCVREEDEQATLDIRKREEIIKNIKNFISQNGYRESYNYISTSHLPSNSNENLGFNIFNHIFEKKKIYDEEMNKILNIQNDNKINSNKENTIMVTANNTGLDNELQIQEKSLMYNFKIPNIIDKLNFLNDNSYQNTPILSSHNITKDFLMSIDKINNQILFSNFFMSYQKNLIEKIFTLIEDYIDNYKSFIKEKENQSLTLNELLEKLKGIPKEEETSSVNIEHEEFRNFCMRIDNFISNNKSKNDEFSELLNNLNLTMKGFKYQNDLIVKNKRTIEDNFIKKEETLKYGTHTPFSTNKIDESLSLSFNENTG